MKYKEREAKGLIKLYMDKLGYTGLASPWNIIYYTDIKNVSIYLRNHELTHLEQMRRYSKWIILSKIIFLIKYNYYWLTRGYENNPYEIEARKASTKVPKYYKEVE